MKKIVLFIGIGLLAVLGVMALGRARVEVAKDHAIGKIDALLGNMEVKRKEIELSVAGLKDGLREIQKAKITAQVKHEQIGRRAEPVEQEVAKIDASLRRLRDHLASDTTLTVGGKVYQQDDLKNLASRLIEQRKVQSDQLAGLRTAQGRLQKVVEALDRKQAEYQKRLADIECQLAVIDSNRTALTAMKDAARAIDSSDKGLAQSVTQLEDKVNGLYAEVEAELRAEDAQWASATKEGQSADAILNAVRTPSDSIAEIDALLGDKVASKK
jgi:chromosome segregation ATPase